MEAIYAAADSLGDVRLRTVLITTPIDSRNTTGHTALMFAAERGAAAAVQALLNNGADANIKSNNGNTALMFAAKRGHVGVIELLLNHGADCIAKNNNGDWALTFAVAEGRVAVAEYLLDHGGSASINFRNNEGESALMIACRHGSLSCIELLFNRNASDKIVNNEGKTVYNICQSRKTLEHLEDVVNAYKARIAAEEAERCARRNEKLCIYIKKVLTLVRVKYLSDFKGKIFTRQASKADLEACGRIGLLEEYEFAPLLKALSVYLNSRVEYSTLDKRLMYAFGNPCSDQVRSAKPLLDLVIKAGVVFPAEPASRANISLYRTAYASALSSILNELEKIGNPSVAATTNTQTTTSR